LHYIILNNKIDLNEEREVSQEEIEEKSLRLGIEVINTSATKKINIDESINKIIEKIIKSVYNTEETSQNNEVKSIESKGNSKSQSISKICKS
jgi:Fe2+ transport system protein B